MSTHSVIFRPEGPRMTARAWQSTPTALDPQALATIADGLAGADPMTFLQPGDCRRWALLASTHSYSAWVIPRPAGTRPGLHAHARSTAAVRVVTGELRERFVVGDTLAPRGLGAGALPVLPADHRHEVVNVG